MRLCLPRRGRAQPYLLKGAEKTVMREYGVENAKGAHITTVYACDVDDARQPARELLDRPGRRRLLLEWQVGGYVIVAVDGETVTRFEDLRAFLGQAEPGHEASFTLLRDGDEVAVPVTLGEPPNSMP